MSKKAKLLLLLVVLALQGCPRDENCEKIMQCEDDVEMFCDKNDSGCGEICNYYTYEYCYEVCKGEENDL